MNTTHGEPRVANRYCLTFSTGEKSCLDGYKSESWENIEPQPAFEVNNSVLQFICVDVNYQHLNAAKPAACTLGVEIVSHFWR